SSFKALGLKDGIPEDVIHAFLDILGPEGTLMMPTFTYSYSGIWNVRPFNPVTTPGAGNGVLTEALKKHPGALRSGHPTYSVAAIGKQAGMITQDKENASAMGKGSSYDAAIGMGAKILLLGVGNNRNSAIHYAEIMADLPYNDIPFREFWGHTALVEKDGQVKEVSLLREYPACSANFGVVDDYLLQQGIMKSGKIECAPCFLMSGKETTEAVVKRLKKEPAWLLCDNFTCEPCSLRKRRLKERQMI
ncbi:MAG: AAC(3) family N-acetyltransferase, partial [Kiritimatiellae bacterium]|nr:AAC(3) family N-acetyltransferase [Kiritimatiellia bacterium]